MSSDDESADGSDDGPTDGTDTDAGAGAGAEAGAGSGAGAADRSDPDSESEDRDDTGPAADADPDQSGDSDSSDAVPPNEAPSRPDGGRAEVSDTDSDADAQADPPADDATDDAGFGTPAFDETADDAGVASDDADPATEDDADPFEDADFGDLDESFADAFDAGATGTEFDEEYSSDIPRIDVGIDGLDEMIQGGVPERSLLVTIGAAGTGKTTFGLHFLQEGLDNGEACVFIALEESREDVLAAAAERDWPFEEHIEEDRLAIIDLDPIEMATSLSALGSELPKLIRDYDASRLVLDSVSLLEMMYDDQGRRRTEIYDFTRSVKQAGVTTMLTSEANEDNPYASRHGIIEYLTDGVFILQYVRSEFRETRLAVEIQKIRNANHSRETKPYEITGDGISVYQQANIF